MPYALQCLSLTVDFVAIFTAKSPRVLSIIYDIIFKTLEYSFQIHDTKQKKKTPKKNQPQN